MGACGLEPLLDLQRVVNLQHDGIVVTGVEEGRQEEVARAMSEMVTASCGYESKVAIERIRSVEAID